MRIDKISHIESEIIDQYLYDENTKRPWIIGFSGGKDSTVVLQLVWNSLLKITQELRNREIYVVCNDTLVENPIIEQYVNKILYKIQEEATKLSLPIFVYKTIPRLEETFWVNLIGKGYPAPNNQFRWCTERLKIKPTSRFILEKVNDKGEAIILLGTRLDESQTRSNSIKKHEIKGKRLTKHQQLPNTFIYSPIKNMMIEEVWGYINTVPSPWGANNRDLFNIYANASADDYECPTLIVNKNSPSCGQSRFGCWVCTVVREDKSTSALIKNGFDWLIPLKEIRDLLVEERNISENREDFRRNGQPLKDGGPYKPDYRAKILERVLLAQKKLQEIYPSVELIAHQELVAIQLNWYNDSYFNINVSEIYNKIYNKELDMRKNEEKFKQEMELLKKSCNENLEHVELINDLLGIQKTKDLMVYKVGLKSGIENRIEEYLENNKLNEN
jgi:DNA sulfur modification protein DndC